MFQTEIVNLEDLVPASHNYRKFAKIWKFKAVEEKLSGLISGNNYEGFGILRLFKCLLLQFMEDLSDRELQSFMQDNISGKWFIVVGSVAKLLIFNFNIYALTLNAKNSNLHAVYA